MSRLSEKIECVLLTLVTEQRTVKTTLEFPYSRTLGPVIGGFIAGLREGHLLASRTRDGRVLSPPLEHDPDTGLAVEPDLVEVGPAATVRSWTWVPAPTRRHPLDRPFAFALLQPDGADTAMVHVVDVARSSDMATGMRVVPRWRAERRGRIDDIEAWEPAP
ncbi:MAG: Zn-ribbon domain-containing OB-fold protein [Actinomycetota bacterium]